MGNHRGFMNKPLIALMAFIAIAVGPAPARADFAADWEQFKHQYIIPDGRVVDTGNNGVSHTEGQGTALLCAVAANDHAAFDSILLWTTANFDLNGNGLYARLWRPNQGVTTSDDAADGDILITWALIRADEKWHVPAYRARALRSIGAIKTMLLQERDGFEILLPGSEGFDQPKAVTINLGYWIFPAFKTFAKLDKDPVWARLGSDGLRLIALARFGQDQLPADWVDLSGQDDLAPSHLYPPRFGHDAMRIPLYLAWGSDHSNRLAALEAPFLTHWDHYQGRKMPAWLDVTTGDTAPFPASSGYRAVMAIARRAVSTAPSSLPALTKTMDYEAASLLMLAELSATARH